MPRRRNRYGWLNAVWRRLGFGGGTATGPESAVTPTAPPRAVAAAPRVVTRPTPDRADETSVGRATSEPTAPTGLAESPSAEDLLPPHPADASFVFDLREDTNPTEQRIALERAMIESGLTEGQAYESVLQRVWVMHNQDELTPEIVWANWETLIEPALTDAIKKATKGPRLRTGGMNRFRERTQRLAGALTAVADQVPIPLVDSLLDKETDVQGSPAELMTNRVRQGLSDDLRTAATTLTEHAAQLRNAREVPVELLAQTAPALRTVTTLLQLDLPELEEEEPRRTGRRRPPNAWNVNITEERAAKIQEHFPVAIGSRPIRTNRARKRGGHYDWVIGTLIRSLREGPRVEGDTDMTAGAIAGLTEPYVLSAGARIAAEREVPEDGLALWRATVDDVHAEAVRAVVEDPALGPGHLKARLGEGLRTAFEAKAPQLGAKPGRSATSR